MPAVTAGIKYLPKADEKGSAGKYGRLTNKNGRPTKNIADRPKSLAGSKKTGPVASSQGRLASIIGTVYLIESPNTQKTPSGMEQGGDESGEPPCENHQKLPLSKSSSSDHMLTIAIPSSSKGNTVQEEEDITTKTEQEMAEEQSSFSIPDAKDGGQTENMQRRNRCAVMFREMKLVWLWVMLLVLASECYGCLEHERVALLQLKASSINDQNPYFLPTWVEAWEGETTADCCKWERVKCNATTGRVIQLLLNSAENYLKLRDWYLNASMFLPFEELDSLDLSCNQLAGWLENEGFFDY
ncbi:hypothetical protein HYC85_022621 [Camellia sinensis]|uniref:Leucine-rich repeat-containing N-terminal plant-type domain-containing protein n=1 Tax=Camellia sinensis TaxID=4442 RepID=A0A7J7GCB1_CAMSI|nr:hypothetical protein HYC85_022621 [Camellia sinensis]